MKPEQALVKIDEVRKEINATTYDKIINHPFVKGQIQNYFVDSPVQSWQKFQSNYMVLISDRDVYKTIENADRFTVVQSLINLSKDNLSINPHDKEACIVSYNGKCVGMAMAKGKIKRMQETGAIKYINYLEVVFDCDKITNSNGKYIHERNLNPPANPKCLGVLLIVTMIDGKERHKFVLDRDIELRRKHAPAKAIWDKWTDEMRRKTVINIFEKEIGKTVLTFSEFTEEEEVEQEQEAIQEQEQEQIQEANVVEEETDILTAQLIEEKKAELLQKIKDNPTALTSKDIDKLQEVIDTFGVEKLQAWIDGINSRIEKAKQEPKDTTPKI